ncbi:MAG TPA: hypothetical protein VK737_04000 [Opitutales bacterium]|jgi:hypothetical protein|nr:hypothetical protein [Opitutales bacterium]
MAIVEQPASADRTVHPVHERRFPFHFVTVVWGTVYTRNFLDLALPTQLAPGNLPSLADQPECLYKIFTTSADAKIIRADAHFLEIGHHVRTHIVEFASSSEGLTFAAMISLYQRAIRETNAANGVMISLAPDMLLSDGCFAALRQLHAQGKRVVLIAGLRASLETFPAALRKAAQPDSNGALSLPPRLLVKLAFDHLHPISQSLFWDSSNFSTHPSQLYWWLQKTPPRMMEMHCFHLHPLLVDGARKDLIPDSTIDDDYVQLVCPDPTTHYTVTDSDEMACVELSHVSHKVGLEGSRDSNIRQIAQWCHESCNETHRKHVEQAIILHEGPLPVGIKECQKRPSEIIQDILCQTIIVQQNERRSQFIAPWLRWIGWLREQCWRGTALRLRYALKNIRETTVKIDASWPTDLIVVHGNVTGQTPLRVQLRLRGGQDIEKVLPPGGFIWSVRAPFAYEPLLRIRTPEATAENRLHVALIVKWRTLLHHLRHNYSSGRPDPIWLEWNGLQPGHRLNGPATVRVVAYWGVSAVALEVELEAIGVPSGNRQTVVLPLNPALPFAPVAVNLPGQFRLRSVVCREKHAWRWTKAIIQILQTIVAAVRSKAGRRRLLMHLGRQTSPAISEQA